MEKITKLSFPESQIRTYLQDSIHKTEKTDSANMYICRLKWSANYRQLPRNPICCPVLKEYSQTLSITAN